MKRMGMWLLLMCKRLLKKPSFVIILVLLPVILLMYRFIISNDEGTLRAVIYVSDECDALTKKVAKGLADMDCAVKFYMTSKEDDLYSDVIAGRAEVGYRFPKNLEERLIKANWDGVITMVVSDTSQYGGFVNEFVTAEIYKQLMEDWLTDYLVNKSGMRFDEEAVRASIRESLVKLSETEEVFDVYYKDMNTSEITERGEAEKENYLMKPIRGTVALFVLLAGLAGLVFWFQDSAEGRFKVMSYERRPFINYGSLLVPTLMAGVVGIVCILISGLSVGFVKETVRMLLYCLFVTGVCEVLRMLVPSVNAICAAIPIIAIGSYLCCPIIVDLKKLLPIVGHLRAILPPDYYLQTFIATSVWALAGAAAVVTVVSIVFEMFDRR